MMTLISIVFSSVLLSAMVSFVGGDYYSAPSRLSVLRGLVLSFLRNIFSGLGSIFVVLLTSLILLFLVTNIAGNIPLMNVGSLYYFLTCSVSLALWLSLIIVICRSQLSSFISHLLPYGSPMALSLFLPLVEIFSQIIRPFTLMIRLSTNLSSGHIMLYMFSYFSLSSLFLSSVIFIFLSMLFVLELMISLLQAYIFSSLVYLYISESV